MFPDLTHVKIGENMKKYISNCIDISSNEAKRNFDPILKQKVAIATDKLQRISDAILPAIEVTSENDYDPISNRLLSDLIAAAKRWSEKIAGQLPDNKDIIDFKDAVSLECSRLMTLVEKKPQFVTPDSILTKELVRTAEKYSQLGMQAISAQKEGSDSIDASVRTITQITENDIRVDIQKD
jgi:hypothetical protein